ncbi:SpoIIE family protein phosphatase [Streptomyces sp. NPDC005708]|uniref:SpoIIE family protein phosphatase n=1 Tax=Streptomyces sp. NPDC005708 TaxID=3154564 RepID=UPI0033F0B3D3
MVGCVIVARRLCRCRGGGPGRCHGLPLPPSRGGPVLGVVPGTEYREGAFTLDEDSALVMVTDGVVEGPGLTLDAGLERAGTLAAQAVHDGLNAERPPTASSTPRSMWITSTTWPCWSSDAHDGARVPMHPRYGLNRSGFGRDSII